MDKAGKAGNEGKVCLLRGSAKLNPPVSKKEFINWVTLFSCAIALKSVTQL